MHNPDKPFGPWNSDEVKSFASSAIGAHEDTRNLRYDLVTVGEELAGRMFDSAMLWTSLESNRLNKFDQYTYNL